jgi:hypothetical protein
LAYFVLQSEMKKRVLNTNTRYQYYKTFFFHKLQILVIN